MERKSDYTRDYKQILLDSFLSYIRRKGFKQKDFSKVIGYSQTWISQWRSGKKEVPDSIAWGIEQFDRAEDVKNEKY